MIQANELRIGNLVKSIPKQKVFQVKIRTLRNLQSGKCYIEPIVITEEWLLNVGFENMEKFPLKYVQRIKYDSLSEFEPCIVVGDLWIPGMRYLHQLQNLYFALTGRELPLSVT